MNYAIVAFAIVLIISVIQWFVDGRKNYTGPQIQMVQDEDEDDVIVPSDSATSAEKVNDHNDPVEMPPKHE
jgi:choline transport protein